VEEGLSSSKPGGAEEAVEGMECPRAQLFAIKLSKQMVVFSLQTETVEAKGKIEVLAYEKGRLRGCFFQWWDWWVLV